MAEFRFEPLTRRWIITGGDRESRPNEYTDSFVKRTDIACPFCGGNEERTPPAIVEMASSNGEKWSVRVVPNKYPAVNGSAPYTLPPRTDATFEVMPGRGVHEVIIETPRHVIDLTDLTQEELVNSFRAYRDRLRAAAEAGLVYAQVFKNTGAAAGASLEHSHSQIIGLPWLPAHLEEQLTSCREHFAVKQQSLLTELMQAELSFDQRIVGQTKNFLAWCPFASRFGYECWVAPHVHAADFRLTSDEDLEELAVFMGDLIGRIKEASGLHAYNLALQSRPFEGDYSYFHWYWQILPRGNKQAGFEWATGHFVNPCLPESCAEAIRAIHPTPTRKRGSN